MRRFLKLSFFGQTSAILAILTIFHNFLFAKWANLSQPEQFGSYICAKLEGYMVPLNVMRRFLKFSFFSSYGPIFSQISPIFSDIRNFFTKTQKYLIWVHQSTLGQVRELGSATKRYATIFEIFIFQPLRADFRPNFRNFSHFNDFSQLFCLQNGLIWVNQSSLGAINVPS